MCREIESTNYSSNGNSLLHEANRNKKDEFYTDLKVIEDEMVYYTNEFKNKVIICNCDDPYESNFFKFFALNFKRLQLKKLIATCYDSSCMAGGQLPLFGIERLNCKEKKHAYKIEITEIPENEDGTYDISNVEYLLKNDKNSLSLLKENGDFRSKECLALLDEADICVTNPPFSLFREFVATLEEHKKKYLIIGNVNAVTYKEIFPLIKEGKLWLGASIHSGDRKFYVPNDYPMNASGCGIDENGRRFINVKGVRWFSNLDYKERHEELVLYRGYNNSYPKYDNYDAIEIEETRNIPVDYYGVMGVPITFLDKYCPNQFEILGMGCGWNGNSPLVTQMYPQTQIQIDKSGNKKLVNKLNDGTPLIKLSTIPLGKTYYQIKEALYIRTYCRVLIRRRTNAN